MRGSLVRSGAVVAWMLISIGCSSSTAADPDPTPTPTEDGGLPDPDAGPPAPPTGCTVPADCPSGVCENGICAFIPGKKCGLGAPVPLCPIGEGCPTDADCASDFCDATKCAAPTAAASSDGRKNGGESDVDCGGNSGKVCALGGKCKTANDCEAGCLVGICVAANDTDGKKNNGETDVDCGGPNAKKCVTGKGCATGPDCGLGYCPATTCVVPTAIDNVQNGTETDLDCGGAAQTFGGVTVAGGPKCALTKVCGADTDCTSAICSNGAAAVGALPAGAKHCIEALSCRQLHGGETCGTGELGVAGAVHESCCKSLEVPGATKVLQGGVMKTVYLDKYEITAGRIRQWIKEIKAQYGGAPNIRAWVKARMLVDPILAAQFPTDKSDYLPSIEGTQTKLIEDDDIPGPTDNFDVGLLSQLGPTSYVRGIAGNGGTSGCAMNSAPPPNFNPADGAFKYGHRTYWFNATEATYFYEVDRPATSTQDLLDEKSMNCITPLMFTAFCAWDGGYMQSVDAISKAYGPSKWPWGDLPEVNNEVTKISNWNSGTGGFNNTKNPRYLWPEVNYATFQGDFSPIIAAPGRFPGDVSQVLPAADTWRDLGGNMIEWSQVNGTWRGWTGASFEGHLYPRAWSGNINYLDKYGKGGSRCMRLK